MDPTQVMRDADGTMRCRQCGFTYDLTEVQVAEQANAGMEAVREAVASTPKERRAVRPEPSVWSVNAYTAHLVDAAGVIMWRVRAIAEQNRPTLPYHDQDEAVEQGREDEIPAEDSVEQLEPIVSEFQRYVVDLPEGAWDRIGVHARAGEVRLSEIAHDMPHELLHHARDIRREGRVR